MNNKEKIEVIKRYSDRFQIFGDHPKTLGWDKERHYLRYRILLSQWKFQGESLLDVGCGFGDMSHFIFENNIDVSYTGVDINEDLIKTGNVKYPETKLLVRDIINSIPENEYDYVVSSGVHNYKLEDNWKFIEDTFRRFNETALKGFAINFISTKVDEEYKKEHIYYTDPSKVLNLAYEFSNRIILRNDYMPFEFTIFIDKRNEFDLNKVVYSID